MKFKNNLKRFFTLVFPQSSWEIVLFLLFFFFYGTLASYIAWNYRIVFDDRIPWDAYFSFDNRAIVMTGGGFERHPLSNYFFDWIRTLALFLSNGKKDAIFRLVLALLSACTISLSLVQIYKYLRNIIVLPVGLSFLITIFFSFFSTNILLSFTPETYTYTLFLLVLFNHYAASQLQQNKQISSSALVLSGVAVGGLTITNIIKIYLPILFENKIFSSSKKFFNAVCRVAISVVVFLFLYLNRLDFDINRIFSKTTEQYEKFSKPKSTPIWDMIYSWFFGGNVLFPSFVIRDYHNKHGFQYKALFMDVYTATTSYIFVGILFGIVLLSGILNRKNKLSNIIMVSFLVDIIIHTVLKFGLHTSYIYGGHFVFVVPIMLGWLFYYFKNSKHLFSLFIVWLIVIMTYLACNNFYRMQEFFYFLDRYYR